ncbi:DUF397 domain-containing protein [Streptomyces sp. NPDC006372]|uniref:DUF397 domain-containing protein n=1 Tax=Streptomyces sp. NPDC006372 TaxID=3155599 RepID=UPI0033B41606
MSCLIGCGRPRGDGGDNNCLEVADDHPGMVPVRDSKLSHSPILVFGASPWALFLAGAEGGSSAGTPG